MRDHDALEWERIRPALGPANATDPGGLNGFAAAVGEVSTASPAGPLKYVAVALQRVGGAEVEGGAGTFSAAGRRVVALPIGGTPTLGQRVVVERVRKRWVVDLHGVEPDDPDDDCPEGPYTCCVAVHDGCHYWEGQAVSITGPDGFSDSVTTGAAGEAACFGFTRPGVYTLTTASPGTGFEGVVQNITLGCRDASVTLVTPVSTGYVGFGSPLGGPRYHPCCCDPAPGPPYYLCDPPRVLKCKHEAYPESITWEAGELGGTATWRDITNIQLGFRNRWVGCVACNINPWGPYLDPNGATGCNDDSFCFDGVTPNHCYRIFDGPTAGVLWVILEPCFSVPGSPTYPRSHAWRCFLQVPMCPSIGRTCDDADFVVPNCDPSLHSCHPTTADPAFYVANFSGYSWSCGPSELRFQFTTAPDLVRKALVESLGSEVVFHLP